MSAAVTLVGASHRTAPVEERERIALAGAEADAATELLAYPGVDEAVVLSTCNRVEVVAAGADLDAVRCSVRRWLTERGQFDDRWFDAHAYELDQQHAVSHLFRVASSLDSLVIGEPQILGQVKQAYTACAEAGGTGPVLNRLFHSAFHVAKRVRTETRIAENAVSVSYAAVELARKVFGRLTGKKVLVIGAGEMGALAVRHLRDAGADEVHVANRTRDRAVEIAAELGGIAHGLDELPTLLETVDIVISSTGSQRFVVKLDDVKAAVSRRRYRRLFLIDIAVPRDIDPRCDSLSNVYLFDVDDLEKVVAANLAARQSEATRAEEFITLEAREFEAWRARAKVVPTIVSLRQKLTRLKDAELEKLRRSNPDMDPAAIDAAARMAHSLINKVLHEPTIRLRESSQSSDARTLVHAVRALFDLTDDAGDDPSGARDPS